MVQESSMKSRVVLVLLLISEASVLSVVLVLWLISVVLLSLQVWYWYCGQLDPPVLTAPFTPGDCLIESGRKVGSASNPQSGVSKKYLTSLSSFSYMYVLSLCLIS